MSDFKLKTYYAGFAACWKLFRKYATAGGADSRQFWDKLIDEARELFDHYADNAFIQGLIKETVNEIERLSNEKTQTK